MQLQPFVRVILIGIAAGVGVISATQDKLPLWAQAVLVGLSTIFAGLGVTPPQVPTRTVVDTENQRVNVVKDTHGYGAVEVLLVVFLALVILAVAFRLF